MGNNSNQSPSFADSIKGLFQYRNKGADEGETCPFCKTIMYTGASVCTGCNAERKVGPKGFLGFFLSLVLMISVLFAIGGIFSCGSLKGGEQMLIIIPWIIIGLIVHFTPLQSSYYK